MRSKLLVILYIVTLVAEGIASPCKYWCKTADWKYYCCDVREEKTEKKNPWASSMAILIPHLWFALGWPNHHVHDQDHQKKEDKPKKMCPKVRDACPRSYDWWYGPPVYCHNDDECISSEKCCYDICLDYKTCKPAE